MKITMMNRHTKQAELQFEIEVDRSDIEFTKRVIDIQARSNGQPDGLIKQAEIETVIEAMENSGVFENHPHCITIIAS